jgi:predicted RNase H-like HicB family nuclease
MQGMLSNFIQKNLAKAKYKLLLDNTYFGEIPGLKGVWANAKSLELCRQELSEVLEDWLFLKLRSKEKISGFIVRTDQRKLVKNAN